VTIPPQTLPSQAREGEAKILAPTNLVCFFFCQNREHSAITRELILKFLSLLPIRREKSGSPILFRSLIRMSVSVLFPYGLMLRLLFPPPSSSLSRLTPPIPPFILLELVFPLFLRIEILSSTLAEVLEYFLPKSLSIPPLHFFVRHLNTKAWDRPFSYPVKSLPSSVLNTILPRII